MSMNAASALSHQTIEARHRLPPTSNTPNELEIASYDESLSTNGSACDLYEKEWNKRREAAERDNTFVSSLFEGKKLDFEPGGHFKCCIIGRRLAKEKDHRSEKNTEWPFDVTGVFDCTLENAAGEPCDGVCKIYLQLPNYEEQYLETKPEREMPAFARAEIEALGIVRAAGDDAPGPRYNGYKFFCQTEDMWVPGGFVCMIFMEKLPGITLCSEWYWRLPISKRNAIRAAFEDSYEKLLKLGLYHQDEALRNLLWDETTQSCYILDFEGVAFIPPEDIPFYKFNESTWEVWGLKQNFLEENGGW